MGFSILMLLLSLIEQPQKLIPKERVGRLDHRTLPHARSGIDKIAQADIGLSLSVDGLHILTVLLLRLLTVEEREFVFVDWQVAGCDVTVDDFLNKGWGTFYSSNWSALWYSSRAYRYFFYE